MDWDSRFVLGWSMGRHMDVRLCLDALDMAMKSGYCPKIFNTDQGSQYTSEDWKKAIIEKVIKISMDGKGRWADNIIMERFWRAYKHEFFLHREPKSLEDAIEMTSKRMAYYNQERPHSSLKNCSPMMYRENHPPPLYSEFFARFFRSGKARFALRPCYARDAMPTLQNRVKNGLTSEGIE